MQVDIRPAGSNAITGFIAKSGLNSIELSWNVPVTDTDYKAAEIWWNTVNDRETGARLGTYTGNSISIPLGKGGTRYFWIRPVNQYGRTDAPFTGPASASLLTLTNQDMTALIFDFTSATIVGALSKDKVTGLGALAALDAVDANTQIVGSLAANRLGAGQLAAGVVYAGKIYANQIVADTLSLMSSKLGQFDQSGTGGRTVISDSGIRVYDGSNALRIKLGNLA